jgi:conserverd hypothetical protein
MRYLLPLLFSATAMANAHAMDTTTQGLVITGYVTSQVTAAPFDRKLVRQARDDAAAFVASDGLIAVHAWRRHSTRCVTTALGTPSATLNWQKQFSSNNQT